MGASLSLVQRELVRFFRQRSRVVGAFGTPIIFWFIIGSGVGDSYQGANIPSDMNYLQYFFPGTLLLILLFTSIFSAISLIVDRNEGFMQSVLVAPISRLQIVLGKVGGGVVFAVLQGVLFLVAAPFIGIGMGLEKILFLSAGMFLISLVLSSMGFLFAWKLNSIQGFHAVMNLIMFPMWLVSGALFPMATAPTWIKIPMYLNPLTYGISILREALYFGENLPAFGGPSLGVSVLVLGVFGTFFLALSVAQLNKR